MALQRVTVGLTELRCIAESDGSGSSEPYLWVTYFAVGAQPLPGQAGPVATITPAYDAFRSEFRTASRRARPRASTWTSTPITPSSAASPC
jgi:hypothetical protein